MVPLWMKNSKANNWTLLAKTDIIELAFVHCLISFYFCRPCCCNYLLQHATHQQDLSYCSWLCVSPICKGFSLAVSWLTTLTGFLFTSGDWCFSRRIEKYFYLKVIVTSPLSVLRLIERISVIAAGKVNTHVKFTCCLQTKILKTTQNTFPMPVRLQYKLHKDIEDSKQLEFYTPLWAYGCARVEFGLHD